MMSKTLKSYWRTTYKQFLQSRRSRECVRAWVSIVFGVLVFLPSVCAWAEGQTLSFQEVTVFRAKNAKLAESRAWRKLLFIPERLLPSTTSLIDDPRFFLAVDGRSNPEAELAATIRALFVRQASGASADQHVRCKYPARWQFLQERLGLKANQLPPVVCPALQKFFERFRYDRVSMVFSNYFAGNPASLFGHTFIKLHRIRPPGEADHPLLDDIINFSAMVDDGYSPLYPFKGLLGFYKGFFALYPYHRKIQEYNNYESRDLWEYDLALSPVEVNRLELVLWELGETRVSYYYLDQNCSYAMLALLEAAAPRLELTGQFRLWAIPSDTLRAVTSGEGILKGVHYRPSAYARYLLRFNMLSQDEALRLEQLITSKDASSDRVWHGCDTNCQAKIIDTALEYFEYKEKIAGSLPAVTYHDLRRQLLLQRAQLAIASPALPNQAKSTRVDLGHASGMVGIYSGFQQAHGGYGELHWRPALQDFSNIPTGYQEQMEVQVVDLKLRKFNGESRLRLRQIDLLAVSSLATDMPLIDAKAWRFAVGAEDQFGFGPQANSERAYLYFETGKAYAALDERLLWFGLGGLDLGYAYASPQKWHLGPRLTTGLLYSPNATWRAMSKLEVARLFNPKPMQRFEITLTGTYQIQQNLELNVELARRSPVIESSFGLRKFF